MDLAVCEKCRAEIRWIIGPDGRRLALDPQAGVIGNVVIERVDESGKEHGRPLGADEDSDLARFVPHSATCRGK